MVFNAKSRASVWFVIFFIFISYEEITISISDKLVTKSSVIKIYALYEAYLKVYDT